MVEKNPKMAAEVKEMIRKGASPNVVAKRVFEQMKGQGRLQKLPKHTPPGLLALEDTGGIVRSPNQRD